METKIKLRRQLFQTAAAVALAMVMLLLPFVQGTAAPDLTGEKTLFVEPSGGQQDAKDFSDDIDNADTVIDLYYVAKAVPVQGYDTYQFAEGDSAFSSLIDSIRNPENKAEEWRKIAGQAAEIAKNGATPAVSGKPVNAEIGGLDAGLYLVIARSDHELDDEGYWGTNDEGEIISKSASQDWVYSFLPELVALPSKEAVDGVIETSNPGDWLDSVRIKLKAERKTRVSNLKIVKTLEKFETKDPATFVFKVEGKKKGVTVYSNVITITFDDGPGTKDYVIDNLPVGAEVKVTEVYSGNDYELTTDKDVTVIIPAKKDVAKAEFTNDYDDEYKGGGSVLNKFDYNNDLVDGSDAPKGWEWTPVRDK